jgi:hypothetical protein
MHESTSAQDHGRELPVNAIAVVRALSEATVANMKQSLAFAVVYNLLGVRRTAGGRIAVFVRRLVAVADDCRSGHEPQLGFRHHQFLAVAPRQTGAAMTAPATTHCLPAPFETCGPGRHQVTDSQLQNVVRYVRVQQESKGIQCQLHKI